MNCHGPATNLALSRIEGPKREFECLSIGDLLFFTLSTRFPVETFLHIEQLAQDVSVMGKQSVQSFLYPGKRHQRSPKDEGPCVTHRPN